MKSDLPISANGSGGATQTLPEEGLWPEARQSFEEAFDAVRELGLIAPVDAPAPLGDVDEGSPEESEMAGPTREEIDAKFMAHEARGETRFVELAGKLDRVSDSILAVNSSLSDKITHIHQLLGKDVNALQTTVTTVGDDVKASRFWVMGTVIATGLTAVGIIIAVWAYAGDAFSRGYQLGEATGKPGQQVGPSAPLPPLQTAPAPVPPAKPPG